MTAVTQANHPTAGHHPPRSAANGRPTLHTQIVAELTKLTSTRAVRWILPSIGVLVALMMSGVVFSGSVSQDGLATDDGLRIVLEHGSLGAVLTLILGIGISAGEYRHRTAVDTFLTEPRRGRVLLAKLSAGAVVGLVAGLIAAASAVATASVWYAAKDIPLDLGSSVVVRSVAGMAGANLLFTLLGVTVGWLIRGQAVAIVSALIWIFAVETAIAQLLVSAGRWLPWTAGLTLGNAPDAGLLPQAGAGVVLLGWVAVLSVAAAVASRRDVTE